MSNLPPRPVPPPPEVPGLTDLQQIGRGGFARVYRAWQAEMRRTVAVKVIDGTVDDPESERRFRREVAAMGAASHHPNVVPVYVTGVTPDARPYLVMPYLPGGSLGDRLRAGPMPAEEVARIGVKVADGLAAAHATGVLHRDVKPSNILFSAYDEPQLGDFGIARLADATRTNSGLVAATIAYAAPEVLSGEPADPATDVYSLAASLHAALSGAPPFAVPSGEPVAASVARAVTQPPPDLRQWSVPEPLVAVIERAMAKDRAPRPATAAAFRDELADAAAARPSPAAVVAAVPGPDTEPEPEPVPPARPTPSRRRPAAIIAGALAIVALVALGVLGLAALDDGEDQTVAPSATTEAPATTARPATDDQTDTDTGEPADTEEAPSEISQPSPETEPAPSTPDPPTTTTTTAPLPTPPAPPSPAAPGAPTAQQTVTQYYQLVDGGSLDAGFQWLTPRYQQEVGFDAYRAFWGSIDGVELSNLDVQGDSGAAVTLRYRMADGSVTEDRAQLRFARNTATGNLLIDDYTVVD